MKKQFLWMLWIISVFPVLSYGQSTSPIPVSPEAAALTKMVDYPINMNTGVPDISIPFYEINVGGLKLPITLQYHAGGFRINEQATRAGLGWSLSSDLQITRTVNGLDDLSGSSGYINNNLVKAYYPNPSACPSCSYPLSGGEAYWLATGTKDAAPDRFTYKLLGKSGSFYFQKNNTGTGYSIVPVPFDNIKIQYNDGMFIITDSDGTVYYFGETGGGDANQLRNKGIEVSGSSVDMGVCVGCILSAWKCKRIVSNTGTDEITFTYSWKTVAEYRTYNDRVEYYNNEDPCGLAWDGYYTSNTYPMNNGTWNYETLDSQIPFHRISSPKYMVVFGNSAKSYFHVPYLNSSSEVVDRVYEKSGVVAGQITDVGGVSVSEITFRGGKVQFSGADRLSSIRVLDQYNQEVKSVHFFQSYTNATYVNESKHYNGPGFQGTMYLDSLHVRNGSDTYERYALYYQDRFCYGNHLKGHDAWGYPNAATMEIAYANNTSGNILSLPTMDILQSRFYRDVQGGCSNFATDVPITIGGNDWAEAADKHAAKRGVIKRIVYPTGGYTDFDFESNQYTEEFTGQYHHEFLPQLSGGLRIRAINRYDADGNFRGQKYYRYGMLEEGAGLLVNRPARTLQYGKFHYGAVDYEQTIAYLKGPSYPQTCWYADCLSILTMETKTTYHAASALDYTYSNGSPIYYQKVTEYQQDHGQQTGKTVHEYYDPDYFYDYNNVPAYYRGRISGTNMNYLRTEGLTGIQKSVTYFKSNGKGIPGYTKIQKKEYEYQRYLKPEQIRVSFAFMRVLYEVAEGNFMGDAYDLYTASGFAVSPYYPGSNYVTGEYGIASAKLVLSRETETSYESGDSLRTVRNYGYSFPYLTPAYIETYDPRESLKIKTILYAHNFPGTAVYDDMVAANMISQPIEEWEENVTQAVETYRKRTDYAVFPVGFGLIAPSSIRSSIRGEPLRTEVTFDEYDQYGNVLQVTGLDSVPVSYLWGYKHLYPVAKLEGVRYAQVPSSYKSNVQIISPVDDGALQTLLDGLRSYFPSGRMVTTYSYRPLVGMSRQVDANGLTTYYEYDGIGRLHLKKDDNQRILSRYEYHTRGPAPVAPNQLTYTNVPLFRSSSIECAPGIRQFYSYVVPGGQYTAPYSQDYADAAARYGAEGYGSSVDLPPCPESSAMAAVRLQASGGSSVASPSYIEVDFIRDGHIVATHQYYEYSTPPEQSTIYVPAGDYKLSLRIDPNVNYQNGCLIAGFYDENYMEFNVGDTYSLQAGQLYNFAITTFIYTTP